MKCLIAFTALILELSNVLSVQLTARWITRKLLWKLLKLHPVHGQLYSAAHFGFQGYSYLLCYDHFSKWPEFSKFQNQTSGNTILHLKCTCSRYGIPDKFIDNINNGPQFSSEASRQFSRDYASFTLPLVLTFRKQDIQLLRKCSDPNKVILAYRITIIDLLRISHPPLFVVGASKLTYQLYRHFWNLQTSAFRIFNNVSKPANTNKNWTLIHMQETICEISFLWKLL